MIAAALLVGFFVELGALLRGAGGDHALRFSTLDDVQLWCGGLGLGALVIAWGAAMDSHPRIEMATVAIAGITWTAWLAFAIIN